MRKTIKYIMAAVLAVCLFCLSAIPAFAYTEGYFRYEITDGVLTITEYFGREESVTVPNMIAGTPVSIIGENVFPEGCGVKSVNLPDTIMKVHSNSFAGSITVIYESSIAATTTTAASAPQSETAAEITTASQETSERPAVTSVTTADQGGAESLPVTTGTNAAVTNVVGTTDRSITEKAPVITETRTENGAVYIEEITEDEEEPEDIGEGGMEEIEEAIIDITAAETSAPGYVEIVPETGTVSEALTTKPAASDEGAANTAANENSDVGAVTDENEEGAAAPAPDNKPAAAEEEKTEGEDNAPATENTPEVSTPKASDNNMLLSVIIYAAASIVVVAVVIIIFIKRKK